VGEQEISVDTLSVDIENSHHRLYEYNVQAGNLRDFQNSIQTNLFLAYFYLRENTVIGLRFLNLLSRASCSDNLSAFWQTDKNAKSNFGKSPSNNRYKSDGLSSLHSTGAGIGTVFGSLIIGYARNPSLKQQLFSYAILGFALSEAMGLFCLMMAFLLLFAF
jgi:F-type H+-transporting ATPase subunit c